MVTDILVTSIIFILFTLLHSVLANRDLKQHIFRKGPAVQPYYRLGYTLISLTTLAAWYFYAPFPKGILYDIPNPWSRILGWQVFCSLCALLM